ncbi:hypothetical protein BDV30DRAFT_55001 [Aspergillus minisclerotigenes]|uniref:Uncharacterized protein n=1 Tax=Aspergillus minisclerotigenes TaxID=656917 RepID=A0A5N6JAT8_9EURO|nr:hypothetical protein BDV30DRAFT_55001 [Aspergillus minisclerotigenes]
MSDFLLLQFFKSRHLVAEIGPVIGWVQLRPRTLDGLPNHIKPASFIFLPRTLIFPAHFCGERRLIA